jgi:hypothetical protein
VQDAEKKAADAEKKAEEERRVMGAVLSRLEDVGTGVVERVASPSEATVELDALKAVVETSVVNKKVYVDVVKIMHEGEPADRVASKRLLSSVSFLVAQGGPSAEGLVRSTFPEGTHGELFSSREENYTGIIAAELARLRPTVAGHGAMWVHQMRSRGADNAAADIVLVVERGDNKFPMCVMEFGKQGDAESKEAQALSCAVNLQPYVKWNHVMLVVEMIYEKAQGHMTVSCVQMSHSEKDTKQARALLWRGDYSETSWARLLLAIEEVVKANALASEYKLSDMLDGKKKAKLWERNRTAAIEYLGNAPGFVWKEVARERAELMTEVLGEKICSVYATRDGRALVSYRYIPGDHVAAKVGQFASLIEQVAQIHGKGFVHGDIRLGNVVFTGDGAELIDFDLCGKARRASYPKRFAANINDGARHGDAGAGRKMKTEHDWFSVVAVMDLFQVADAGDGSASDVLVSAKKLLKSGQHAKAAEMLAKHMDVAVKAMSTYVPGAISRTEHCHTRNLSR